MIRSKLDSGPKKPTPLIKLKSVHNNSIRFFLSDEFSKRYVRKPLHLAYPEDVNLELLPESIVNIPVITNVIPVIWFSGNQYTIDEMDKDLYYSLIKIKSFFKRFFYNTSWDGDLIPTRLVKNTPPLAKSKSASLFTGGLDSTTTVLRHFDEDLSLISFNATHQTAAKFAKKHGFDHHSIVTNCLQFLKLTTLDKASIDITKWFWDTTMGLSWVGSAAPFLYVKGISALYIPSGFTWQSFVFPDGQTMRQPASPLIDENLNPFGLKVVHDDFTMTRTDKIKFVSTFSSQHNIPKPRLIVCTYHRKSDTSYLNCNKCMKCMLTMLDILAIGEDLSDYGFTVTEPEFSSQFKSYMENLKMRRGGTYAALKDTQNYVKQNIDSLPQARRPFYDWFVNIDLWALVDKSIEDSSKRPLRASPFNWKDYSDIYPGIEEFVHD